MRTVVLRVVALALLLLLVLVSAITVRTLRHLPDTVVYLIRSDPTGFTLVPVYRRAARGGSTTQVEREIAALAAGPTADEAARGLASAVPATTRVLGARREGTALTVDLSADFERGGGTASMVGRLNQLFYTLARPDGVDSVALEVEGRTVHFFGGEGIEVPQPWRPPASGGLPSW